MPAPNNVEQSQRSRSTTTTTTTTREGGPSEGGAPGDHKGCCVKFGRKKGRFIVDTRLVLGASTILLVLTASLGSWIVTMNATEENKVIFALTDDIGKFRSETAAAWGNLRRGMTVLPAAALVNKSDELVYDVAAAEMYTVLRRCDWLRGNTASAKRKVSVLRTRKIYDYIDETERQANFVFWANANVIPTLPIHDPVEFIWAMKHLDDVYTKQSLTITGEKDAAARRVARRAARKVQRTSVVLTSGAHVVGLVALICLLVALMRIFEEARSEVACQEKLARQQSHEMRNKFAPSISLMEVILELNSAADLQSLKPDIRAALALLHEVETQHQARLMCYRIMRGDYRETYETFDLIEFIKSRLDSAVTISRAKRERDAVQTVEFRRELPQGLGPRNRPHIRCDLFILTHLSENFLNNAAKFTSTGAITFAFLGEHKGLLCFQVRDTGTGIPESIRTKLFRTEVTTGSERGCGLGLASCSVFSRAAGGYAKLVESHVQDSGGGGGSSVFEFAVKGELVGIENLAEGSDVADLESGLSPSDVTPPEAVSGIAVLPSGVNVVIIDDSDVNRKCVLLRLQRVARACGATDWKYSQYHCFEASQPHLRTLANDPLTIVTIDENMAPKGGVMTGQDGLRWLASLRFRGFMASVSGDAHIGPAHVQLGAMCVWGKPLPAWESMHADLATHFCSSLSPLTPASHASEDNNASLTPVPIVEKLEHVPEAADAAPEYRQIPSNESDHSDADALPETPPELAREPPKTELPGDVQVVIIDDSDVNRKVMLLRLQKVARSAGATGWNYSQYHCFEAAQPHLRTLMQNAMTIVTIDENMAPKGGIMTGQEGIRWLVSLRFMGFMASASGDAHMGPKHISLGAHCAWGKPLPSPDKMRANLTAHFDAVANPDLNATPASSQVDLTIVPPTPSDSAAIFSTSPTDTVTTTSPNAPIDSSGRSSDAAHFPHEIADAELPAELPDNVQVIIIDDSDVNRKVVLLRLQKVARSAGATGWNYSQYHSFEAAQPHLRSVMRNKLTIVTIDENMAPKGGIMTGQEGIIWLVSLQFKGFMASASGDAHMGQVHTRLGAHCAWGKPLPNANKMRADITDFFTPATQRLPSGSVASEPV